MAKKDKERPPPIWSFLWRFIWRFRWIFFIVLAFTNSYWLMLSIGTPEQRQKYGMLVHIISSLALTAIISTFSIIVLCPFYSAYRCCCPRRNRYSE
jgi:magnesium-transporting ATPase (P-type)